MVSLPVVSPLLKTFGQRKFVSLSESVLLLKVFQEHVICYQSVSVRVCECVRERDVSGELTFGCSVFCSCSHHNAVSVNSVLFNYLKWVIMKIQPEPQERLNSI